MPQYLYTVINKENKELNGSINAPDELAARHELNALGFSILALHIETTAAIPEQTIENIKKFDFSAIDKNGKKIVGTIQGENIFTVYKRLLIEYQFDVQSLYSSDLSTDEKDKAILKGVDELKDQLVEEQLLFKQTEQIGV